MDFLEEPACRNLRPRKALILAAATVGALLLVSCSLLLDSGQQQCTGDEDCAAAGPAYALWRCSGNLCYPPELDAGVELPRGFECLADLPAPQPGLISRRIHFTDYILNQPVTEGDAKLCDAYDVNCLNPLQEGLHPDGEGVIVLSIESTFTGYLEIHIPDRFPTLVWLSPEAYPKEGGPPAHTVPVVSEAMFEAFGKLMDLVLDQTAGHVMGLVVDCDNNPAAGTVVTLTVAHGEVPIFFYISSSGFPVEASATDTSGRWGGFNVPPGVGELVAHSATTQHLLGKSALLVRPRHVTITTLAPSSP